MLIEVAIGANSMTTILVKDALFECLEVREEQSEREPARSLGQDTISVHSTKKFEDGSVADLVNTKERQTMLSMDSGKAASIEAQVYR